MTTTTFLGDKEIGRIGFGAMQLAGPGVFGPPRDPDAARAVLRRAIELGVDHIDTSQYYGPDVVNELIRETLHPYPANLKRVTKVGAKPDDRGAWLPALGPRELREGVEANLRSLRVERMDLVNLRLVGGGHGDPDVPLADQLGELEALRQEGKLDLIGVSNVTLEEARQAVDLADVAGVQNAYSLLDRSARPGPRAVPRARDGVHPVLPARLGLHRRTEDPAREPDRRAGGREARCNADAGRASAKTRRGRPWAASSRSSGVVRVC
jgi:aryl-alcohol dehydrogenase-like predicted oxidoreductase